MNFKNIKYSLLNVMLHSLAYLPFCVLYVLSDLCFILIFHVFRYRRRIAAKNIDESFPELSVKERKRILRKFYLHFCDNFVETIKLLHVSDDEMRKRMQFTNIAELDKSIANGKSVIMYAAHFCNWEWLSAITMWTECGPDVIQFGQVYRPLKDKWFDKFFLDLRNRFHSTCYAKNSVARDLIRAKMGNKITVTGFISDQHPNHNDEEDVIRFLNHDTAMITGGEVLAKKLDMDVLFFDVHKAKRGHYVCDVKVITREPKNTAKYEITNDYAKLLEDAIRKSPSEWLWTHNRWKNKVKIKEQKTENE